MTRESCVGNRSLLPVGVVTDGALVGTDGVHGSANDYKAAYEQIHVLIKRPNMLAFDKPLLCTQILD